MASNPKMWGSHEVLAQRSQKRFGSVGSPVEAEDAFETASKRADQMRRALRGSFGC